VYLIDWCIYIGSILPPQPPANWVLWEADIQWFRPIYVQWWGRRKSCPPPKVLYWELCFFRNFVCETRWLWLTPPIRQHYFSSNNKSIFINLMSIKYFSGNI
jgi:hypothetical protein